jgi:NAD(P)-dependent dehydrogenase (short-subunit alcohol dehydrogenase family)
MQSESALHARNWGLPPSASSGEPMAVLPLDDVGPAEPVGVGVEAIEGDGALGETGAELARGAVTIGGFSDVRAQAGRIRAAREAMAMERSIDNAYIASEADMRDLKGRVAVVTGGASGIGRAMADRFAREGMKIVLADVEEKPLAAAREELAGRGVEVIAVITDVSKADAVDALARRTFEAFGGAHVLCNNAGIGTGGMSWELSHADWEWVLGVNLWGVIHGIRAFVPRMIAQGSGHVVNTASIAGLLSAPGMGPYCASKHGVVAISECLHHDLSLAAGGVVKVSVVCPAWVKTNIADSSRNRPSWLPPRPGGGQSQAEQLMDGLMRQAIAGGIPPAEVADQVLQAVVEERFWVLTHPKTSRAVEKRMQGILAGKSPEFDPNHL